MGVNVVFTMYSFRVQRRTPMVGKALLAVSLAVGGWVGAGVAHADNIMNLGTYAGDVITQLQDWGYNVMLNGLDRDIAYMGETQKRECHVLGMHPVVSEPLKSGEWQTVYVDLSCPGNPSSSTPSGT
jgi:hypothetical protein